ncbi:MAG TPA: DUF5663 domain-containing protein [Candidatus Saccharimonadales bacterium]|nr:DUF5663 domain-containing protein [Candidatus Saccharimonadales bacterium]
MQDVNDIIKEIGADSLELEAQKQVLEQFFTMLNDRVGIALGEQMTDDQLDTFDKVREEGGDEKAFEWLAQNVPEYPNIYRKEFEGLKEEIKEVVADLGATSS